MEKPEKFKKMTVLFIVFLLMIVATPAFAANGGNNIEVAILPPAAEKAILKGRSMFNVPPEYFLEGKGVVKYTPVVLIIYRFPFNVTEVYAVSAVLVNGRKKYACIWHGHYNNGKELKFYKKVNWQQGEFFVVRAKDIFNKGEKISFSFPLYHKKVIISFRTKYYWFHPCWYARVKVFKTKTLGCFSKNTLYIFKF